MQVVRTAVWVVITAALVAFMAMNWTKAPVNFWPLSSGNFLHVEWPVSVIGLAFFLLGMLPTWLISKLGRWRLTRRIGALENSVRASASPPIATATQLDAEAHTQSPESPVV